jgi:hypothetical protein
VKINAVHEAVRAVAHGPFASANDLANLAAPNPAPIYDGPAPNVPATIARYATAYDEAAWRLLAARHPRRFKKAMREVDWLLSHHRHYLKRVL